MLVGHLSALEPSQKEFMFELERKITTLRADFQRELRATMEGFGCASCPSQKR